VIGLLQDGNYEVPASWQEQFFEKLVAAANEAGDARLATARLHRRKKTASFTHPQLRKVECQFANSRNAGSQAQVLLIECRPKRGTEIDAPVLKRQMHDAGIGGDLLVEDQSLFFQRQWGFGAGAAFPVHDSRRVSGLTGWAVRTLTLLLDHAEKRRHVIAPKVIGGAEAPIDLHVALEHYLEDLLEQQWDNLPWAEEFEYLDRQVECGTLGTLDILAKDRSTGDYVVIELKRDQGDDEVVGQCSRYMGWVKKHRADPAGVAVRGIIVAHEVTDRLRAAASAQETITVYAYQFSVSLTTIVTEIGVGS
jgi:hypothetical protein